jgi:HEAT repeat protein
VKWLLLGVLLVTACSGRAEDDIRAHVTIAVNYEGTQAVQAAEYLARYGKKAIPTIESAMHTASPPARKNLILALRRIGDVESVPLLRHIALYDPAPDVRREAGWTLKQWAAGKSGEPLTEKARAAVRALDEAQGSEEPG